MGVIDAVDAINFLLIYYSIDMSIEIIPVEMPIDITNMNDFLENLGSRVEGLLMDKDILVIASKILLKAKRLYIKLDDVEPSNKAVSLANKYDMDPRFVELILKNSSIVLGGVDGVLLTYIDNVLSANSGLDRKNIGIDMASLPPHLLRGSAEEVAEYIHREFGLKVAVLITDSIVYPLRMGTRQYVVDLYGLPPLIDYRGGRDLYDRTIQFTRMNLADEIASAAHLVMGEGDEATPLAIVRGVSYSYLDEDRVDDLYIKPSQCLYQTLYPQDMKNR